MSKVELLIDGELIGTDAEPMNEFIYSFPNVDVTKGENVEAIAYDLRDNIIGRDEIKRAGTPATVRLTPHMGAEGFLADGSDLMYFDVEVVDSEGNICPLSYDKINFELNGDATFMGGYNSGYAKNKKSGRGAGETVIGKDYVYAECGINRIFIKAGRTAGNISLTATLEGGCVAPVTVSFSTSEYPEKIEGGLTVHPQQSLDFGIMPEVVEEGIASLKPLGKLVSIFKNDWDISDYIYAVEKNESTKNIYTVTVNGIKIALVNEAYKPDSATGVICDVKPVLDELKSLGADFDYRESVDGTITMMSKKGQNGIDGNMHSFVIKEGQTAIGYDGDAEGILTNAEIASENGQLMLEIAALMSYIDGVSTTTDDVGKIFGIVYTAN